MIIKLGYVKVFKLLNVYSNFILSIFVGIQFPEFLVNAANMPEVQQIGLNHMCQTPSCHVT